MRKVLVETREHRSGIACKPDLGLANAIELFRVDIDLDQRELVVSAPVRELNCTGRDRDHDIGPRPQRMAARQRVSERMAIVEYAASAAIGHDRRAAIRSCRCRP